MTLCKREKQPLPLRGAEPLTLDPFKTTRFPGGWGGHKTSILGFESLNTKRELFSCSEHAECVISSPSPVFPKDKWTDVTTREERRGQ